MYLKSIEVQGFKSFANKLVFEFHQGITGIVGPNGSGKSNVADAVRWVLGEQSAKSLRSGNMQDVIFAGTETRKPMSFASVSITFDNEDHKLPVDYSEVTVSRRLYRSGESEYLLNKVPVRLKEIKDIFYDTGIGKEGYSIIGQGQVERILSGKPEERRQLFDEAAGIVKFKKRKAETQKKLADEHQNFLRVNDILSELSSQLDPLKKQSASARIYLDSKEKLKNLDMNLFQLEEAHIDRQLKEIAERSEIADNDTRETRAQFEKTRAEYEQVEQDLDEIDRKMANLKEESSKNAVIRQQLQGQIDLLNEQIASLKRSSDQFGARNGQIESELEAKKEELDKLTADYEKADREFQTISDQEGQESSRLQEIERDLSDTLGQIDRAKNDVIGMLNSRASVKGKIQRYDTMLEQMGIRQSEIGGRLLRMKENENSASAESGQFDTELKKLEDSRRDLQQQYDQVSRKAETLQKELARMNADLEASQSVFHRDSSRLEALSAMAERFEGYSLGIRKVMEQKERNPGIKGVVADLIDVPARYEQAIEIALGGSVRNIVTDNEATAKYLIEYLKSNRFGRVTFLPLTSIRGRSFNNQEILREQGVIGRASDLVETDSIYGQLKEYLLGRIVVVEKIDDAIRLGRKYHHSVYMVTLQGESFAPGGSMTGGSFKNSENLIGRKREIEELTDRVKNHKGRQESLRQDLELKRSERNVCRERLTALSDEIQKIRLKANTVSISKKQADEQLRLGKINRNALEKEHADIVQQMQEVREKCSDITRSLSESEEAEEEIKKKTSDLQSRSEELQKERERQADRLEQAHVRYASLEQKTAFQKSSLDRLKQEIQSLKDEKNAIAEQVSGSRGEEESKKRQIEEIRLTIKEGEAKSRLNEEEEENLTREKKRLSENHKDFFDKRDGLSERLSQLDRETFRLNSQKERLEEARDQGVSYVWDEYEMTPSEVRAFMVTDFREDRQAVKKDINKLKDQIRKLGSVNVNAIEEYKSLLERHTFLTAQHDDLIESEATLNGIIDELDKGMRKQFHEKFAAIQTEFDKSFKDLFGGGRGLLTVDPDADILEADISITAHPPGKKLQNMMQLSGGEKALTAIALLFAIQNLKPSPFCLLDEIEAALDDSNVSRYAQYLHKLTKNTQFIIITHRRGTMTAADRLYGITMQEKGISTLVSVNLIEDSLSK